MREFAGYPRPKPPAIGENGRPRRDHVVHETMTADELACRKCRFTLSQPHGHVHKDHRGSGGPPMAGNSLGDHAEVLQKVPQAASGPDRRRPAKRALRDKRHGPDSDAAMHDRLV